MIYSVYYSPKYDCVFASIDGEIELETLSEFVGEVAFETSAHHCMRVLNDVRKAVFKLSVLELLKIPRIMKEEGLNPVCKRALIISRDFGVYRFSVES